MGCRIDVQTTIIRAIRKSKEQNKTNNDADQHPQWWPEKHQPGTVCISQPSSPPLDYLEPQPFPHRQTSQVAAENSMSTNAIEEFRAGVTACLRSWSALRTAVESGWGGGERESQGKADDLRKSIFDIMDGSQCPLPNFDEQDLADNLAIYLEEEFSVTLEDGSEQQVADAIFRMYETCAKGDTTLAREMVARADRAVEFNAQFPVQIQTTEHDDDDGDEDMDDTDNGNGLVQPTPTLQVSSLPILLDYNSQPLFGEAKKVSANTAPVRQLGDTAEPIKEVIEMDDDGFAPVKPKGRRKK